MAKCRWRKHDLHPHPLPGVRRVHWGRRRRKHQPGGGPGALAPRPGRLWRPEDLGRRRRSRLHPTTLSGSLPRAPACGAGYGTPFGPAERPLTLLRGCGDLGHHGRSHYLSLPPKPAPPVPKRRKPARLTRTPIFIGIPRDGVCINSNVQCVFVKLVPQPERGKAPRLRPRPRGFAEPSRPPPVVCVTVCAGCVRARVLARIRARGAPRARGRAAGAGRPGAGVPGRARGGGRGPGFGPPREPAPRSRGPCNGTCSPLRVKKLETLFAQQSAPRSRQSV